MRENLKKFESLPPLSRFTLIDLQKSLNSPWSIADNDLHSNREHNVIEDIQCTRSISNQISKDTNRSENESSIDHRK